MNGPAEATHERLLWSMTGQGKPRVVVELEDPPRVLTVGDEFDIEGQTYRVTGIRWSEKAQRQIASVEPVGEST